MCDQYVDATQEKKLPASSIVKRIWAIGVEVMIKANRLIRFLRPLHLAINILALCMVATLLQGCDPKEMNVTVTTSAIEKAMSGEVAQANVLITFELGGMESDKIDQLVKAAKEYIGGGTITISGDDDGKKAIVKMKIPVRENTMERKGDDLLTLIIQDEEVLGIVPNTLRMRSLNRRLKAIDFSAEVGLFAEKTTFNIVGTTAKSITLSGIGTVVDGEMHLEVRRVVPEGETVAFEFRGGRGMGGSSGSIYGTYLPQLRINPRGAPIKRISATEFKKCTEDL